MKLYVSQELQIKILQFFLSQKEMENRKGAIIPPGLLFLIQRLDDIGTLCDLLRNCARRFSENCTFAVAPQMDSQVNKIVHDLCKKRKRTTDNNWSAKYIGILYASWCAKL